MKIKVSSGESIIPRTLPAKQSIIYPKTEFKFEDIFDSNSVKDSIDKMILCLDNLNKSIDEIKMRQCFNNIINKKTDKHRCPNCGAAKRIIDNCEYCGI